MAIDFVVVVVFFFFFAIIASFCEGKILNE